MSGQEKGLDVASTQANNQASGPGSNSLINHIDESAKCQAALSYAADGLPVFPCSKDKKPLTAHGFKDATTDQEQIKSWWDKWPDASIGMPTGRPSGLWVLDADIYKPDGKESFEQLMHKHGELPFTKSQTTGGGGKQYFFKYNGSIPSSNGKIAPGLDIKADGGYIILPPSNHPSGNQYQWDDPDSPVADAPEWLIQAATDKPKERTIRLKKTTTGLSRYGLQALHEESENLRKLPEGQRNDGLNKAAFSLGQLVAGGELSEKLMVSTLLDAALDSGLEQRDSELTILSGLEAGKKDPRQAPDSAHAEQAEEEQAGKELIAISLYDFLGMEFPPRQNVLEPWLPWQGLAMIHAPRGVGKTHVAVGIGIACATGGDFLTWSAPTPVGVCHIDGEMPDPVLQRRLSSEIIRQGKNPKAPYILITNDLQTEGMPKLDAIAGQERVESVLTDQIKLIIVDNVSTLTGTKENDADGWTPVQAWALRQRAKGRTVLFVHHSGKGGAQRGTSRREDVLDSVLVFKRPVDYQPDLGAVFEIHFEKARGLYGENVQPIEARLTTDQDGKSIWTTRLVEACTFDRVVELANEGLSQKEIAVELNINKSNVSRHLKKAKEQGLIKSQG